MLSTFGEYQIIIPSNRNESCAGTDSGFDYNMMTKNCFANEKMQVNQLSGSSLQVLHIFSICCKKKRQCLWIPVIIIYVDYKKNEKRFLCDLS